METKPYNLQSPEQIAKDYAGNKQKIAEAMQMGILDPTAGTLAGMFIDRMRSAAQMEAAPQQTVAQQVFNPAPPAAPGGAMPQGGMQPPAPAGPPAGLGATPEAAMMAQQMPAPEMAPPEMPAEEAPMGMAGGGRVHGHFNASDKGSSYGANLSLGDDTDFSLEGAGRRILDPDMIRAILRHRKGDAQFSAEHTLRGGSDYKYEKPFLGGQLGIHAGASRGFIPDSVRASYSRQFAEGGMVPPYAMGGGLSSLPLPDDMFDENRNGGFNDGYRGGGLVAFATGDEVDGGTLPSRIGPDGEIIVEHKKEEKKAPPKVAKYPTTPDFLVPQNIYGMKSDVLGNLDTVNEAALRETKQAKRYQEYLDKMLNPESQKEQRKQDFWMSMGQLGAKMATTPGSILQAFSAGAAEAIPGLRDAAKAQRAEELGAYQTLAGEERTANKELETRLGVALDMSKAYATAADAMKAQAFKDLLTRLGFDVDLAAAKISSGASLAGALASAGASRFSSRLGLQGDILRNNSAARAEAIKDISEGGAYYKDYLKRGDAAYKDRYKFYGGLDTSGWSADRE